MKKINNKSISIEVPVKEDGEVVIKSVKKKYSELLQEAINNPPAEGFTVSEMQHRLDIRKQLEKAKDIITLEDKDFLKVRECVKAMRWKFISEDIIEFSKEIIIG